MAEKIITCRSINNMDKDKIPHPLYSEEMILIDIKGKVKLVYAPFLKYEAPEIIGKGIISGVKVNHHSLEQKL